MKLKEKLILSYVILITLPLAILGAGYYYASKEMMLSLARENVLEIVKKNNQIIDERLSEIQSESLYLMVECDVSQIFNGSGPVGDLQLLQADRKVTEILNRYFSQSNDLYSVQLVTRAYVYGSKSKNTFPPRQFFQSDLYARAVAGKGRIAWVPTYDYTHMYQLPELTGTALDYRYLFSGVRELNPSCVRDDTVVKPKNGSERPVLVMNLQEQVDADTFRNSIPIQGASFFVISENGTIVSTQDKTKLGEVEVFPWMHDVRTINRQWYDVRYGRWRKNDRLLCHLCRYRLDVGRPYSAECTDEGHAPNDQLDYRYACGLLARAVTLVRLSAFGTNHIAHQ